MFNLYVFFCTLQLYQLTSTVYCNFTLKKKKEFFSAIMRKKNWKFWIFYFQPNISWEVSVDFVINAVTEDKTDILFAEKLVPRSPLDRNTLIGNGQALTNKTEEEVKIGTTRSSEMLYVKGIHVPDCARGTS